MQTCWYATTSANAFMAVLCITGCHGVGCCSTTILNRRLLTTCRFWAQGHILLVVLVVGTAAVAQVAGLRD
jgi:hypothetical protein